MNLDFMTSIPVIKRPDGLYEEQSFDLSTAVPFSNSDKSMLDSVEEMFQIDEDVIDADWELSAERKPFDLVKFVDEDLDKAMLSVFEKIGQSEKATEMFGQFVDIVSGGRTLEEAEALSSAYINTIREFPKNIDSLAKIVTPGIRRDVKEALSYFKDPVGSFKRDLDQFTRKTKRQEIEKATDLDKQQAIKGLVDILDFTFGPYIKKVRGIGGLLQPEGERTAKSMLTQAAKDVLESPEAGEYAARATERRLEGKDKFSNLDVLLGAGEGMLTDILSLSLANNPKKFFEYFKNLPAKIKQERRAEVYKAIEKDLPKIRMAIYENYLKRFPAVAKNSEVKKSLMDGIAREITPQSIEKFAETDAFFGDYFSVKVLESIPRFGGLKALLSQRGEVPQIGHKVSFSQAGKMLTGKIVEIVGDRLKIDLGGKMVIAMKDQLSVPPVKIPKFTGNNSADAYGKSIQGDIGKVKQLEEYIQGMKQRNAELMKQYDEVSVEESGPIEIEMNDLTQQISLANDALKIANEYKSVSTDVRLSQQQVLEKLSDKSKIDFWSSSKRIGQKSNETGLEGLKSGLVDYVADFTNKNNLKVVITGGTEEGAHYKVGDKIDGGVIEAGHSEGNKIDLRSQYQDDNKISQEQITELNSKIEGFGSIGYRKDKGKLEEGFLDKSSGVVYFKEGNHWDLEFRPNPWNIYYKNGKLKGKFENGQFVPKTKQKIESSVKGIKGFIEEKKYERVDNLRRHLKLPTLSNMTQEQLDEYANVLSNYEEGDVFLTARQFETVHKTNLEGIATLREAKEKLSQELGVEISELENIKVSELDRMRYDTALARQNPFYDLMVKETAGQMLIAEDKFLKFENELNDFVIKARNSKKRTVSDVLIPTDKIVFDYLSSENKADIIKNMTVEEVELAEFLRSKYAEALEYLIQNNVLKTGRENYITNIRRGFLEAAKEDGLVAAFKEAFDQYQMDEAVFNILDQKTGNILPLEKFFEFSMKRTGGIKPTKNVAKAASRYFQVLEKKKALDAIIPKLMIYVDSLTPKQKTPRGLEMDNTLKNFVKEWINTKKGRPTKALVKPGGKIDLGLKAINAFISILDMGFNIPVGMTANIGESVANFINLGNKKWALGESRKQTKQGKAIAKKYQNFVGKTLWDELIEPSKDISDKFTESLFGLFQISERNANETFLLGSLTKDEFDSGIISNKRLAELKVLMGRTRAISEFKSILGATTEGKIITKYKTWAVPVLSSVADDVSKIIENLQSSPEKVLSSKEFREILNMAEVTLIALLVGSLYDEDKNDRSFIGQLLSKAKRESLTVLGALDSKMMLAVPRLIQWLAELGEAINQIIRLEKYKTKSRRTAGKLKGVERIKRQLTPRVIKTLIPDKRKSSKRRIK